MKQKIDLLTASNEEILKLRFCDLGVEIKGTWLEECVAALYRELSVKGITFHPRCYLADEWLAPDKEPVIGIPFYLAHSRLKEIEQRLMHDVEGEDPVSCMKLLRHEAGHAINYAYQLYKRKKWRDYFGHFYEEYPDHYKYQPYSRSFVIHLEDGYAQYHPDEDFAETFAVWLTPDSKWDEKYKQWKAIEKLLYVDFVMRSIAHKPPKIISGKKFWNIASLKTTLATHYKRKSEFYAESSPDFHDVHLYEIFPANQPGARKNGARLLSKYKKNILNNVAFWTGERKFVINRLYKNLFDRCRKLSIESGADETLPIMKFTAYITTLVMNYIYTSRFKRKK